MIYELRISYSDGTTKNISDVEEFVAGFEYLFVRTYTKTLSLARRGMVRVERRVDNENAWFPVRMKKPKVRKKEMAPPVGGNG